MSKLTRIEMVVHLQSVELFAYCSAEQVVRMASIARQQRYVPGERIYSIDEPAERLYCIVRGGVELEGLDGQRRVESTGTFGAREILSDHPRAERATALEACEMLEIDSDDLFDLLSNNIEIVKALFRRLLRPSDGQPNHVQSNNGRSSHQAPDHQAPNHQAPNHQATSSAHLDDQAPMRSTVQGGGSTE